MLLFLIILWVRNLNRAQRESSYLFHVVPAGGWSIQDVSETYTSGASRWVTQAARGWLEELNIGHRKQGALFLTFGWVPQVFTIQSCALNSPCGFCIWFLPQGSWASYRQGIRANAARPSQSLGPERAVCHLIAFFWLK